MWTFKSGAFSLLRMRVCAIATSILLHSVTLFELVRGERDRHVEVTTAQQLARAIQDGAEDVLVSSRITGRKQEGLDAAEDSNDAWDVDRYINFPQVPDDCLTDPTLCLSNASYYVIVEKPTTITAASSDVLWDMGFQRRRIILSENLILQNFTLRGFGSAFSPYIFFFVFHGDVTLTCENCRIEDGCLGEDVREHVLQGMNMEYMTENFSVSEDNMTLNVDAVTYNVSQDITDGSQQSQIFHNFTWICNHELLDDVELDTTVRPGDECQQWFDRGASYRGTVNVTLTGHTCKQWNESDLIQDYGISVPHLFPGAGLVENYCRNPDGSTGVWCHTVDGPWSDTCNVPFCKPEELRTSTPLDAPSQAEGARTTSSRRRAVIRWVGGSVGAVVGAALLVGGAFLLKEIHLARQAQKGQSFPDTGTDSADRTFKSRSNIASRRYGVLKTRPGPTVTDPMLTTDAGQSMQAWSPRRVAPSAYASDTSKTSVMRFMHEQLDCFSAEHLLLRRYHLLGVNQRRTGGQSVVQFARRTDGTGTSLYAIKFFAKREAYVEEATMYRTSPPNLQRFMPAVVKYADNVDGVIQDPFGNPLPPFIIMEKGESLSDRASNMPVDMFTAAQILGHVSERIAELHESGYVHRDLKPGNIMWQPRTYSWVLIDFGIACRIGEPAPVGFSPSYAAPETVQAHHRGDKTVLADAAVDAWALGVIAFELLVQKPAFGRFADMSEVHHEVLDDNQPMPWDSERITEDDQMKLGRFSAGIQLLLQRDPAARASVREFCSFVKEVFSSKFSGRPIAMNSSGHSIGEPTGATITQFHDVASQF